MVGGTDMVGVAAIVITHLDGAAAGRSAGAAIAARPVTGRRAGAESIRTPTRRLRALAIVRTVEWGSIKHRFLPADTISSDTLRSGSYEIITQQHGGTITVDSKVGYFTEFTVLLPRRRHAVA
jgi:hypothetical protein